MSFLISFFFFFFFNDTATTEIYTLSLHDALPIWLQGGGLFHELLGPLPRMAVHPEIAAVDHPPDRKSTRLNSSHSQISYAVFCLKKKKKNKERNSVHHNDRSTYMSTNRSIVSTS